MPIMRPEKPSTEEFHSLLRKCRVIPGLKTLTMLKQACAVRAPVVFFLTGTIFSLRDAVRYCHEHGTLLFAHVDLLHGIGKDPEGMRYLAHEIGVNGILTTRSFLVKAAAKEGLLTVQRLFALDSEALKTGLEVIKASRPDAVEILPALVLPSIAYRLPFSELPPVIAGGLLETRAEVEAVLATPVVAVSTSRPELWRCARD
jgi:glycerol uptake operon antiterminator